jgi:calcium-dependent protein kinase
MKLKRAIEIEAYKENYTIGVPLGRGAFGTVVQITDKRNGRKFALKSIRITNPAIRRQTVQEARIVQELTRKVNHPNLIAIHQVFEDGQILCMRLDLCSGGEMFDRICRKGHFSEKDASFYLTKIMNGLRALHQHNVLHLDIKPENLLFSTNDEHAELKICDFGLSQVTEGKKKNEHNASSMGGLNGTVGYKLM